MLGDVVVNYRDLLGEGPASRVTYEMVTFRYFLYILHLIYHFWRLGFRKGFELHFEVCRCGKIVN